MIHYELFFEYKTDNALGTYGTYGIAAYQDGILVKSISDVSCEKEKIAALADSLNTNLLELEHLPQAVEEFIYDYEV